MLLLLFTVDINILRDTLFHNEEIMTKKIKQKRIKTKVPATGESQAPQIPVPSVPVQASATVQEPAREQARTVESLYYEACDEEDQNELRKYAQVIQVLRGKGFSFRGIADWLNERGFKTDRNEVYRIYCKILPPDREAMEGEAADREASLGM